MKFIEVCYCCFLIHRSWTLTKMFLLESRIFCYLKPLVIVGVCFKTRPIINRAKQLLSLKECSEVHVREEKDLMFYSVIDENHFCHLLRLETSDEYCRTSGLEIVMDRAGQLFYEDGTYI